MKPKPSIDSNHTTQLSTDLLRELRAAARTARRNHTLDRLAEACDHLEKQGHPITLAGIQKHLESVYGQNIGPKAQSISNDKGLKGNNKLDGAAPSMHQYVLARQREQQSVLRPSPVRLAGKKAWNEVIDEIPDMDLQAQMRNLAVQLGLTRAENVRARALFKEFQPGMDFDELVAAWQQGKRPSARPSTPATSTVPTQLVAALQRVVSLLQDPDHLSTFSLTFDGSRVKRKGGMGDTLIEADDLRGLKALLEFLSESTKGIPELCINRDSHEHGQGLTTAAV